MLKNGFFSKFKSYFVFFRRILYFWKQIPKKERQLLKERHNDQEVAFESGLNGLHKKGIEKLTCEVGRDLVKPKIDEKVGRDLVKISFEN